MRSLSNIQAAGLKGIILEQKEANSDYVLHGDELLGIIAERSIRTGKFLRHGHDIYFCLGQKLKKNGTISIWDKVDQH